MRGEFKWPNLKKLNASKNSIQDQGLEILISQNWTFLKDLNLRLTEITAQGIDDLVIRSNFPNLTKLDLSKNEEFFFEERQNLASKISQKWPVLKNLELPSYKFKPLDLKSGSSNLNNISNAERNDFISNWEPMDFLD